MADLGNIARYGTQPLASQAASPRCELRCISCDGQYYVLGAKDTSEGNPSQPSLRLDKKGKWRFRWVVASGTRTISIDVKQAVNVDPRPTLVVKANPSIGVNSDVTGTAGSSTGWVTIGPVTAEPTSDGVLWVELRVNLDYQYGPCYWDNISTT